MLEQILIWINRRERIRLIASIESALGMMNIKEIVTADPRLDALIVSFELDDGHDDEARQLNPM